MQGETFGLGTTASGPFVVMAKPVGPLCNLKCDYCYYLETEHFYNSPHQFRMSDSMLEAYIRQYIAASPGPVIQFTWHGGEPTLAGLDFYRLAVNLQKQYLPEGWSCWNNLQTNGILLDDEWCSFLAENRFDVGLSIDGTQWLHDKNRKDHRGGGTYECAVAAVRRLQAHGIQPDLLCTVTSATAKEPLAVYRALRDLGTGWIQFIPIVRHTTDGQMTEESVTAEGYGHFLCTVFDEWLHHDLGRLDVQLFAELILVWSGGAASLCWMAPSCGRVLVVEHDGRVYSCDHFVTPDYRIGNIETASLSTLVDLPLQRRFGNDKQTLLPLQCRTCPWLAVCNGGCPKDRVASAENGEQGLNYLCSGFRQFFAHAENSLKQVVQLRKRGLTPDAIMAELRDESLLRWRGVGRNDLCPCGSGRKAKHCCWSKRP
ncbi:anaerobic sulfatase maturase [Desulfosporosinus sp. PR]|uniref:anaerobic sulfatase maturase n=1 Tax=Candidatus Desulfosporosinus nitrosoreducens TaxID=3401928 RepID=UPI0027E692F2|nr:anaerobic sulfatase maturase [Desulfosporosinus sp. PR]MDQ7095633.1 anaerobic sulfatase maturase [Desulfosporosinus sp. PR]